MRVCFWHSDKPRESILSDAFGDGVKAHGDKFESRALLPEPVVADCDVAVMVGVKSRELFWMHWRAGVRTIYLDKGYTRHTAPGPIKIWEYWRTAVNGHHPTETFQKEPKPSDRADRLGLKLKPWRNESITGHVVIAGSSEKYHLFYGMRDPTRYVQKVVAEIRRNSPREIIYRPKPSWRDAVPVEGTTYSGPSEHIEQVLSNAHVLITHGSNACFEAVLMGIPCIVLGNAVAKPISSTSLSDVVSPRLATDKERKQWLNDLMYCQWTMKEFASGEAWKHLRPQIYG